MIDKKRLVVLDSLRGIAAIIVLFHHFFKLNKSVFKLYFEGYLYKIFEIISDLNKEAVLFFFVLSGFSIGLSLKSNRLDNFRTINEYVYRRLKRILPIYWISIVIALIAGILMNKVNLNDFSFYNFIGNVLFLQTSAVGTPAWFTPYGLNGPLWSLAFEFFFYMLFPILYVLNAQYGTKINHLYKFSMLIFSVFFAIGLNKLFFFPYLLFYSAFPVWLLGYLSAQTYLHNKRYDLLFFLVALSGVFYMSIGRNYFESNTLQLISKGFLIGAVFYFITIGNLLFSKTNIFVKILNIAFYKIGKGSYAIYALHYPLLLVLRHYDIAMLTQILCVAVYIFFCIILEEITIQWKWIFLKRNYCLPFNVRHLPIER